MCLESVSGHICKRVASLDAVWVGCVAVLFLFTVSVWSFVALCLLTVVSCVVCLVLFHGLRPKHVEL